MLRKADIAPRPWGQGCLSWDLVDRADLLVVQEIMPPGTREARHRHRRARQVFFVLDGELEIEVDGVTTKLARQDALEVPPGAAHQVFNRSTRDAEFLATAHPTTKGDREACDG